MNSLTVFEIVANGYIYLYERGGSYSLNVREITIEGAGNLMVAFEKLKEKLSKEGLFDDKYKKPIPYFPQKIAVITSETGAAVRGYNKNNKKQKQYCRCFGVSLFGAGTRCCG